MESGKYWYLLLLLGLILAGIGIWVLLTPGEAYLALAILFGFTFLFTGVLETVYALTIRRRFRRWGWSLAAGLIDLIIGLLLVSRPEVSMLVLPLYVGFAILVRSVLGISWSLELKKRGVRDWGSLLALGILGLLFALLMLFNPVLGGLTIVIYTGLAFISAGIFQVYLSLQLRKLKQVADNGR